MNSSAENNRSVFNVIFNTKMLICIFTGFASGLPLYVLVQLVPAWFQSEEVNIKTIGIFTLTQIPYIWKFLWAPFMDNMSPFGLGRRKGWMLISQITLFVIIAGMGLCSPQLNTLFIAGLSFTVALFSATQDVALDAFRRELLDDNEQGLGNSIHVNAYRIAGLVPGSLSLILSSYFSWDIVFAVTACFMLPVIIITLFLKEPPHQSPTQTEISDIITKPFLEFIHRNGIKSALLILTFIFLYKLGDSMATSLATPFYLQMGFSNNDIGLIAKNASLWPTILGAFIGGMMMIKIGINRALWLFGLVQIASILGFVWLSAQGPFDIININETISLAAVISFEYFGVGLGSAAFISFIARTTNPLYTATQFALFTSLASMPRTLISASTGFMVDQLGWTNFFWLCTIFAIPGMLLLFKVAPWQIKNS